MLKFYLTLRIAGYHFSLNLSPVFYTNVPQTFWSRVSDTVTPEKANHQHWRFSGTLILNLRVSFFKSVCHIHTKLKEGDRNF